MRGIRFCLKLSEHVEHINIVIGYNTIKRLARCFFPNSNGFRVSFPRIVGQPQLRS